MLKKISKFLENTPNQFNFTIAILYNKAIELYQQGERGCYDNVTDFNLIYNFSSELVAFMDLLDNYMDLMVKTYPTPIQFMISLKSYIRDRKLAKLRENIANKQSTIFREVPSRSRRNVPRVDYTGMDTIEPESEYDGITDIWYDLTLQEDPDYVPEEDDF
jgi:hypothetical protein